MINKVNLGFIDWIGDNTSANDNIIKWAKKNGFDYYYRMQELHVDIGSYGFYWKFDYNGTVAGKIPLTFIEP